MNDTVYEHEISLRSQGYDDLSDSLDKALDEINKKVAQSTEYQQAILNDALTLVKTNSSDISEYIKGVLGTAGAKMSEDTKTVVSNIGNTNIALNNLGTTVSGLTTTTSKLVESLTGIKDIDTSPIDKGIAGLKELIATFGDISNDKKGKPVANSTLTTNKTTTTTATPAINKNTDFAKAVKTIKTSIVAKPITTKHIVDVLASKDSIDKFVKKHGKKGKKSHKKNYGDFNKKLFSKTGYILEADQRKSLAKQLGVSYNDDSKSGNLYKKLKSLGYFAKGSKYIPKDILGLTQEEGQELVYHRADGAILTPLGKGDKVFTAQMTDNLWKLAQDASLRDNGLSELSAPIINNTNTVSPVININFDNFMTVQGNVDKNAIADIKKFKAEMVDEFTKTMTNEMNLLGHKVRF